MVDGERGAHMVRRWCWDAYYLEKLQQQQINRQTHTHNGQLKWPSMRARRLWTTRTSTAKLDGHEDELGRTYNPSINEPIFSRVDNNQAAREKEWMEKKTTKTQLAATTTVLLTDRPTDRPKIYWSDSYGICARLGTRLFGQHLFCIDLRCTEQQPLPGSIWLEEKTTHFAARWPFSATHYPFRIYLFIFIRCYAFE